MEFIPKDFHPKLQAQVNEMQKKDRNLKKQPVLPTNPAFWTREAWQYSTDAGCYIENPFIQAMPYPPVVQRNSTFAHAAVAGEYLQRLCPGYLSRTRWDSQDTTLVVSWMKMGEVCFGMPTLHRGIFHGLYMLYCLYA